MIVETVKLKIWFNDIIFIGFYNCFKPCGDLPRLPYPREILGDPFVGLEPLAYGYFTFPMARESEESLSD